MAEIIQQVLLNKSMESLAEVLRSKGFRVKTVYEAEINGEPCVPAITLDPSENGLEAAEIAIEHNYPLGRISYQYDYIAGGRSRPYWVMEFLTSRYILV